MTGFYRRTFRLLSPILRSPWSPWPFSWKRAKAVGLPLTVLSLLFLAYTRLGPYFPGLFAHRGFNWERIIIRMALTDQGIYGVTLMVSSSYVFMFILFGAFLAASRTSEFFNDFSLALAGRYRGGPAKVAVVASALMGSISGSAQANVATTGAFTIPLMKRVGYMPHFAGAVEAAASTGGILMPPIMGASAFIMSTFLGIPYVKIMIAGFTPALLYYLAIMFMVDLRAKKRGLKGMEPRDIPSLKATMLDKGHMTIPLAVIIYLLVAGYTPLYSAFLGLFAIVLVSSLKRSTRMGIREVIEALDGGTQSAAPVGISCAIVGFIVGAVGMTGLGQVIAMNVIMFAGGKLWAALILCMIAAIILGMGLPATPCYIITATIAAPALQRMGVHPLAAHFFAFYYGTMSAVIPPVALTSYTAAGLAGARPFKVAMAALGLALSGLLLPYLFVYNPDLLFIDFVLPKYLFDVATAIIGVFSLSCGIIGMLRRDMPFWERALFVLAGILMVNPLRMLRISSFAFFAVLVAGTGSPQTGRRAERILPRRVVIDSPKKIRERRLRFSRQCDIFIQLSFNERKVEGPPSHRTAQLVFRSMRISRAFSRGRWLHRPLFIFHTEVKGYSSKKRRW